MGDNFTPKYITGVANKSKTAGRSVSALATAQVSFGIKLPKKHIPT